MKFFDFFDKLDKMTKEEREKQAPVEKPKVCGDKITDIKEYKRMYYLCNIEIYRERNRNYRLNKKNNIKNNI
jgi:hypothetical protein